MANKKYWKVVCRYGHVGARKEVSVSRYIETDSNCNLVDLLKIISKMPGVKSGNSLLHSIVKAEAINKELYNEGIEEEKQNIFLQRLKTFNEFL